jgi:hypothetical protein
MGFCFALSELSFRFGRIMMRTVPVVLAPLRTQTLRTRNTIRAMRRMVPTKPPPMYIQISGKYSSKASEHAQSHPVGALAHIAACDDAYAA